MVYAPDEIPEDTLVAQARRIEALEAQLKALAGANWLRTAGIRTEPGQFIIDGSLLVLGNLAVPNGSITNDALAAPTSGDTGTTFASGLSLTSTAAVVAAVSVTVPAGFTIARIMATSSLAAGSSTAVNCRTRIQGDDGGMLTGVSGVASSAHAVTLTGLSGGDTITASTLAASIPNTSTGMANTTILALFFR